MSNQWAFLGKPYKYKNFFIYPPSYLDALEIKDFNLLAKLLTTTVENIHDEIIAREGYENLDSINLSEAPEPFDYLLTRSRMNPLLKEKVEEGFLLFTREKIYIDFEGQSIFVGGAEKLLEDVELIEDLPSLIIKKENFLEFQNLIRIAIGEDVIAPPMERHERAWKMLAKSRERDRIQAKTQNLNRGIDARIESLCLLGIGITPFNLDKISYAAGERLMNRYQRKDNYETQLRIATSGFGGGDMKSLSHWMWDKKELK